MPPRLIFLDIDGVLNGHEKHPNGYSGIRPGCVYQLNRVIAETGATLVISSAWRYLMNAAMSADGFRYLLMTYGLCPDGHISGRTCADELIPDRGDQIAAWLADSVRRGGDSPSYVILDDGSDEAPHPPATMPLTASLAPYANRWVRTDGSVGLTEADAERAITILKGQQ